MLGVLGFLVLTPLGRGLLEDAFGWWTDTAAVWVTEQISEIGDEDKPAGTGAPARGACGEVDPPFDAMVSESQAIRTAIRFWENKRKIDCSDVETEFSRNDGGLRWSVKIPAGRKGCHLTALIDAWSGEAINGGGRCP